MKKIFCISLLMILIMSSIFSSTTVFAGYEETSTNTNASNLTSVVNYNTFIKTRSAINDESILIIPATNLDSVDFTLIKDLLNQNTPVLLGYTSFAELLSKTVNCDLVDFSRISQILEENSEIAQKYSNNGYIELCVSAESKLIFSGFVTKAQSEELILKNYNMYKGNYTYEVDESSIVTKETTTNNTRALKGNYKLLFYNSSRTDHNHVYASTSTNSSVISSLYRCEMVQDLETEVDTTYNDSYGGTYNDTYHKVQVNNSSGTLVTGYLLRSRGYDPNTGDEGWIIDDTIYHYFDTLYNLLKELYNSNYNNARTDGHIAYLNGDYGVRVKTATGYYTSSGSLILTLAVNNYVWIDSAATTKCGYNNPQYLTVEGISTSAAGGVMSYVDTTFIDAGLLTANPNNYKIDLRWC